MNTDSACNVSAKRFVLSPVYCMHNGVVVVCQKENRIIFGVTNLDNALLKESLYKSVRNFCGLNNLMLDVEFIQLSEIELKKNISVLLGRGNEIRKKDDEKISQISDEENAASVLLESLIDEAVMRNATDIHIEENCVRFRVLGRLCRYIVLEEKMRNSLVQRIKLLASLNVVEKRRCQDGQFVYARSGHRNVYVRVSCMPVISMEKEELCESLVLRLLDVERMPLEIECLGFDSKNLLLLKNLCAKENGLILICGATGSGKSTTACAMLRFIKEKFNDEKKILSLEDPPEYVMEGICQTKIHRELSMDFGEVLRGAFRQDPDVIFVGEIRDSLTADTAVQGALTGHLVIATFHAGSFGQCMSRLKDLCENNEIVDEVVQGIILQKLREGKLDANIFICEEENKNDF